MEVVRYREIKNYADRYCALCGGDVTGYELVIAETSLSPSTWLCCYCAEEVACLWEEELYPRLFKK